MSNGWADMSEILRFFLSKSNFVVVRMYPAVASAG